MEIIIVMIGFSLSIALLFLIAFTWAVKNGQYDDTYTPSMRMLFSEETHKTTSNKNNNKKNKDQE